MSLLTEIQQDAVNQNIEISTLLRKCKILAVRLKHEDFKKWVESELDGYSSKDELPNYRIIDVISFGNFVGPFRSITNMAIPSLALPEEVRNSLKKTFLTSGISTYANLIKDSENKPLIAHWPANIMAIYGNNIIENMVCIGAWQSLGKNQIQGVVDTVRNRVLSFMLEMEQQAPNAGEFPSNEHTISLEKMNAVFQTIIYGNVGNIASGSSNLSQTSSIEIVQNDLESLINFLKTQNIEEKDLKDLKNALKKDKKPIIGKTFGKNISGWMGKMVTKAASGVWKISTSVAAEVLSKALMKYYGL